MTRRKSEEGDTGEVATAGHPAVGNGVLIITRSDRGVWFDCCGRLEINPRDRKIRYLCIGHAGIMAAYKGGGVDFVAWGDTPERISAE